jgi:hypothetical protein
MLEQAFAVTLEEIDLMLAAHLVHRPDVVDRMCFCHLRQELVEKLRLGLNAIEHFVAGECDLIADQSLCPGKEIKRPLAGLGQTISSSGRWLRWLG